MKRLIPFLFLAFGLFLLLFVGYYFIWADRTGPTITFSHTAESVASHFPIDVVATDPSGVKRIQVFATVNGATITLLDQRLTPIQQAQQTAQFTLSNLQLTNGTVELMIQATDDASLLLSNTTQKKRTLTIDNTPPRLSVKNPTMTIRKGGGSLAIYSTDKPLLQTGVRVGTLFFPGYQQENGDYFCFFAFPYNVAIEEYKPEIIGIDHAGNGVVFPLHPNAINRIFKHDVIRVTQNFLDRKADEFHKIAPGNMPLLERFLAVNNTTRQHNAQTLMAIGKNTSPVILWSNAFLALPRGAVRAQFAEHRRYMWNEELVDEQTHLGYDLASTTKAPVPAASNGVVVFAEYLGIYGNLVVIDHGLGLQSLYSHLSEITVTAGQNIKRGETLGKTGTTGIALGDHLHFGILLSGLEVSPIEWLDAKWMRDNVITPIKDSGGTPPQFAEPAPKAKPTAKPAAQKTKKKKKR